MKKNREAKGEVCEKGESRARENRAGTARSQSAPQAAGPPLPPRGFPTRQALLPGTTEGPGTASSAPPASVAGSRGRSPKQIQAGAAAPLQV